MIIAKVPVPAYHPVRNLGATAFILQKLAVPFLNLLQDTVDNLNEKLFGL